VSSKWSLPFRLSDQKFLCICHNSHACCVLCPPHPHLILFS
jgi:hypothetical protein